MNTQLAPGTPVNLDNCAAEPIHVPGSIQPHGVLLAFTPDGRLATRSANAALLGALPEVGGGIDAQHFTASIRERLLGAFNDEDGVDAFEVTLPDGRTADLTLHRHEGLLFAEFEPRDGSQLPAADFAVLAQRALTRVQAQTDLAALLEAGTEEVARLSGFDRVMGYLFHPDESGEIVAERRRSPELEPYLGLHYPASDIPAQARRLFILNPIRLIVDVAYKPVPLVPDRNPLTGAPIDLSHAVLRSVSPIHCEYLGNMGVHASMAISIVVQGRLWGMFACHHYQPLLVSAPVRRTCRLLSQVVSLMAERLLATRRSEQVARGQKIRSALVERVRADEYMPRALAAGKPSALDVVRAAGLAVGLMDQIQSAGVVPAARCLTHLFEWLDQRGASSFATSCITEDAPQLLASCDGFAGLLAIRYTTERNGWLVWFRQEQVQTQRWAGDPAKPVVVGPNGARLSPRGSFAEWQQVVRGKAEPWDEAELFDAEELRRALLDISAARLQEVVRAREMLLAMLGHDLRSPVQAIAMAGATLKLDEERVAQVQKHIARVSGRMGRLINHVLDLSRVHAGFNLVQQRAPRDFGQLLEDVVNEARYAHPEITVELRHDALGSVNIDADRILQVLSNLISNARHHGTAGKPIQVHAERRDSTVVVQVTNHGSPLTEQALATLFEPFKRGSIDNAENPRGLGLGLYIASTIVREHGGELGVDSHDGLVTFTVTLPLNPA
jgi:chemotaxis family two-component system sensor kinase Cph1